MLRQPNTIKVIDDAIKIANIPLNGQSPNLLIIPLRAPMATEGKR